jgi:hypothetical protein
MRHNMKKHEHIGLLLIFLGTTWFGFALYGTLLAANRMLVQNMPLIAGKELLLFPMFYGISAVIFMMGIIELRELKPGKNRD